MVEEKTDVVKEKKKVDTYIVGQVPTQMEAVIRNTETEEIYDSLTMLCKIANDIEEIKKGILG